MAHKRAFSKTIIETDAFQDMSQTAQLLYFYLNMSADDDGFVGNPKRIMRAGGFAEDDYKVLLAKRFLLAFESGVVVIKHWLIHNTIRKDRYNETSYLGEKKTLLIKENKAYTEQNKGVATKWQPMVSQMATQDKIKEDKTKEDKIKEDKIISEQSSQVKEVMNIFYKINPTLNWGNKTDRNACLDLIGKFGFGDTKKFAEAAVAIQGRAYAPRITKPYQLQSKLAELKIYFDSEKSKKPKITKYESPN